MSAADRHRWDQHYSQSQRSQYPAPDPILLQFTPVPTASERLRAVDIAGGLGQNGLWLAEQGYSVDIIDVSRVGLGRARSEMGLRNLRNVNLLQMDLDTLELNSATYEMVIVFRYLKRQLFPKIKQAVRSGGRVIYETFNTHYLEQVPDFNPDFLLEPDELATYFSDWKIIHYEEINYRSQLVAVRP